MRDQATTSAAGEAPSSTHKRRVAMVSPEEAAPEPTAWPTVFFFFLPALAAWVLPLALTWHSPRLWTVPVSTLANYVLYTVMHEALHRCVHGMRVRALACVRVSMYVCVYVCVYLVSARAVLSGHTSRGGVTS